MATKKKEDLPWKTTKAPAKKAVASKSVKPAAKKSASKQKEEVPAEEPALQPEQIVSAIIKKYKLPRAQGAVVDLLYNTRNKRLSINKEVKTLQEKETDLKNYFIYSLPKSESNGLAGKEARIKIEKDDAPRVDDWPKLYAHIVAIYNDHMKRKTGMQDSAFALLNRALNDSTVNEQWAAGKAVPGVSKFTVVKVGINKL